MHFAVTASTPGLAGLTPRIGPRLVLSSADKHDDVALGIPGALAGLAGHPGRAVWLGEGGPVSCQVAIDRSVGSPDEPVHTPPQGPPPLRLVALPHVVTSADLGTMANGAGSGLVGAMSVPVPVGLGGDEAQPVYLDLADGALVVGPSGSGRSTTLLHIARHAQAAGLLRAVIARDGPLAQLDAPVTATAFVPAAVVLRARSAPRPATPAARGRDRRPRPPGPGVPARGRRARRAAARRARGRRRIDDHQRRRGVPRPARGAAPRRRGVVRLPPRAGATTSTAEGWDGSATPGRPARAAPSSSGAHTSNLSSS